MRCGIERVNAQTLGRERVPRALSSVEICLMLLGDDVFNRPDDSIIPDHLISEGAMQTIVIY